MYPEICSVYLCHHPPEMRTNAAPPSSSRSVNWRCAKWRAHVLLLPYACRGCNSKNVNDSLNLWSPAGDGVSSTRPESQIVRVIFFLEPFGSRAEFKGLHHQGVARNWETRWHLRCYTLYVLRYLCHVTRYGRGVKGARAPGQLLTIYQIIQGFISNSIRQACRPLSPARLPNFHHSLVPAPHCDISSLRWATNRGLSLLTMTVLGNNNHSANQHNSSFNSKWISHSSRHLQEYMQPVQFERKNPQLSTANVSFAFILRLNWYLFQ